MSGIGFVSRMFSFSLRRMARDKYSILAELLELLVPLVLFYGLYKTQFFDEGGVIKLTLLLLVAIAIGTGTRIGVALVNYRNQGFLQEVYSSPLSSTVKIAGLMAEPLIIGLSRTVIALALIMLMGFTITPVQGIAIAAIEMAAMLFSGLITIPIASKLNSANILTIAMWLISFLQFGISGLLISAKDLPAIALNPYSYPMDILLHVSGMAVNYSFALDVAVTAAIVLVAYLLARHSIDTLEV